MATKDPWSIRYDVVRRSDNEWVSCCAYGDGVGFETFKEAYEIMNRLKKASSEDCGRSDSYDIHPLAVHADHGSLNVTGLSDEGDEDSDDDSQRTN